MKVIFLGTPDFAVATLDALVNSVHKVVCAVSQPDRAKDRKGNLISTPVKAYALSRGIPVHQFERIRTDGIEVLKSFNADVMVTAAYGQILSKEILDMTPYGVVNVHASLLPKYRGSAPIQWAVINGEKETGVTIMQTDVGVDNGDILAVQKTVIKENETAGELTERLKNIGAKLLVETLDRMEKGEVKACPQDESHATKCRMLEKKDGHIDFNCDMQSIVDRCNGVTPFPGAYAFWNDDILKLGSVRAVKGNFGECGVVDVEKGRIIVACADGGISIERLQLPGKKMMTATEFLNGHEGIHGAKLK